MKQESNSIAGIARSGAYAARESIEHTLHEMLTWFDQHVKNAPSKSAVPSGSIAN